MISQHTNTARSMSHHRRPRQHSPLRRLLCVHAAGRRDISAVRSGVRGLSGKHGCCRQPARSTPACVRRRVAANTPPPPQIPVMIVETGGQRGGGGRGIRPVSRAAAAGCSGAHHRPHGSTPITDPTGWTDDTPTAAAQSSPCRNMEEGPCSGHPAYNHHSKPGK